MTALVPVAVDEAEVVDRGQALGERRPELKDPCLVERAALGDGLGQGRPWDIGGGHPRRVRVRVRAHHCGGVETADPPGGSYLAGEPAAELRVAGVVRVHHLDRDLAPAARLAQEHPAHAALAQAAKQPEGADLAGVAGLQPIHKPHPLASPQALQGD